MLNILYFGRLSDRAQRREARIEMPANVSSLNDLKNWLNQQHELEGALDDPCIKTMVNQKLVFDNLMLNGNEEIGFLPPVGGG